MSTPGSHLFSHVLMCLRTQSLSALHGCSHLLECQHMSIQTTEQRVTRIPVFERGGFKLNYQLQPRGRRSSREMQWRDMESSYYEFEIQEPTTQERARCPPDVLHSVRSLLCTATNETPYERLFGFSCRSPAGASIPTWLATPGPVYIKRQVRKSKMDPLVDDGGQGECGVTLRTKAGN